MRKMALPLVALLLPSGGAAAEKGLSGEDAAYIDWGVNNCGAISTDKEHAMVDQANAKDLAGFMRQYMGKDLSDALSTPNKQAEMCADIKDWYGPLGSRIPGLLKWNRAAAAAPDKAANSSSSAGGRGRRRSTQ